ncbi:redoxin family protein [Chitinophaga caseinilytica]|uniref:redoxin family protein n=1 Tax=Chitinophaga caseinilytica TaxID=2267521 RepID=UPI003C30CB7E
MAASFIFIAFLQSVVNQAVAQDSPVPGKNYVISGHLDGLPDGSVIYLTNATEDTMNKSVSKGEDFRFIGRMPFGADFYFLKIDRSINPMNKSKALWLENSKMSLTGDVVDLEELKLSGSGAHNDYLKYAEILKRVKDNDLTEVTAFIAANMHSSFTPFVLSRLFNYYPLDTVKAFYSKMAPDVKKSEYGSKVNLEIARRERFPAFYADGPKGNIMPDFGVMDGEGNVSSLHSILAKNKLTLIDVWASWCKPCRAAVPELKDAREKLKGKGFDIVGLSVDDSEAPWKKAMAEDKTPWLHFIDKFSGGASGVLGVWNLPAYFLVDDKGKILYLQNLVIQKPGEKPLTDPTFVGNNRLMPVLDSLLKHIN